MFRFTAVAAGLSLAGRARRIEYAGESRAPRARGAADAVTPIQQVKAMQHPLETVLAGHPPRFR